MMTEQFYTILTSIGKAKIANANVLGDKINLTTIAVGDGNGKYYNPVETQETLVNEVWKGNIQSISVDKDNPNWIIAEAIIPSNAGGFMIREVGLFNEENELLVIAKYPETYKPIVSNGATKDLRIRLILEVSNAANVTLKINPAVIFATKEDLTKVEKQVTSTLEKNNNKIDEKIKEVNTQYEDFEKKVTNDNAQNKKDLDKKVQDFIDTKNKPNGIASLGEDGKVIKEQLPCIDNISIRGETYEPILQAKPSKEFLWFGDIQFKINLVPKILVNNTEYIYIVLGNSNASICKYRKRDLKLVAKLENLNTNVQVTIDSNYIYIITSISYNDYQLQKINLNNLQVEKSVSLQGVYSYIVSDNNYIYITTVNVGTFKFNKSDLSIVAQNSNYLYNIVITDNFLFGTNNNLIKKYNKNTLQLIGEINENGVNHIYKLPYNNKLYYTVNWSNLFELDISTLEHKEIDYDSSKKLGINLINNDILYYHINEFLYKYDLKTGQKVEGYIKSNYKHVECVDNEFWYAFEGSEERHDLRIGVYYIGEIYKVLGYKKIG